MNTPLHLYQPLNTLKPWGDDIWIADGGLIRMKFPLGLTIPFSTRMTVVRLADGGLWYSYLCYTIPNPYIHHCYHNLRRQYLLHSYPKHA